MVSKPLRAVVCRFLTEDLGCGNDHDPCGRPDHNLDHGPDGRLCAASECFDGVVLATVHAGETLPHGDHGPDPTQIAKKPTEVFWPTTSRVQSVMSVMVARQ